MVVPSRSPSSRPRPKWRKTMGGRGFRQERLPIDSGSSCHTRRRPWPELSTSTSTSTRACRTHVTAIIGPLTHMGRTTHSLSSLGRATQTLCSSLIQHPLVLHTALKTNKHIEAYNVDQRHSMPEDPQNEIQGGSPESDETETSAAQVVSVSSSLATNPSTLTEHRIRTSDTG